LEAPPHLCTVTRRASDGRGIVLCWEASPACVARRGQSMHTIQCAGALLTAGVIRPTRPPLPTDISSSQMIQPRRRRELSGSRRRGAGRRPASECPGVPARMEAGGADAAPGSVRCGRHSRGAGRGRHVPVACARDDPVRLASAPGAGAVHGLVRRRRRRGVWRLVIED
jgi:hypothetical protein